MGNQSAVLQHRSPYTPLDWPTRMNIAIEIARSLHYLHTQENVVHGNLTSGSILLDGQANARISHDAIRKSRTAVGRTVVPTFGPFGYLPPKLSQLSRANIKTDVYSFGVIMLEILTGKSAMVPINGLGLPQWVTSVLAGGRTQEVFDPELTRDDAMGKTGDELHNTLCLALRCVDPWPYARPEVLQVLQQLEEIKHETLGAAKAATAKGGDESTDEVAGTTAATTTTGKSISPSSSSDMAEDRITDPFQNSESGTSEASNLLASDENPRTSVTQSIVSSVSISPSSLTEAMPTTINSFKDDYESTSPGDLEEGENTLTPAPPKEMSQDYSKNDELPVPFEPGDVEITTSMPSETREFFINLATGDQPEGSDRAPCSSNNTDEFLDARQAQPIRNAVPELEEDPQPLSIEVDCKTGESVTTSEGVPAHHPPSSINWAEVTLDARIEVPSSPPLIASGPDLGYQRYFQTLYNLARRSPPLPSTVLAVQLNRMIMGLHSLGYPLDTWLKAATLLLDSMEKREYIELHVGHHKACLETQSAELASVEVTVKEMMSRTKSDITTLEQRLEELDETIAKLESQLAVAKARREEVAGSLAIARDQLLEAEAKMESVSADMGRLNRQYSELPNLANAMLRHELPSLDEVFDSNFLEIMTRKF